MLIAFFTVLGWCHADSTAARLDSQASVTCKILLVPGAFGSGMSSLFLDSRDYFSEYETFFQHQGCEVLRVQFLQDSTIEVRAAMLRDQANRFLAKGISHAAIIAHSQGGLDARFAVKELGLSHIDSIVTIGSPHQGTQLADWVIKNRESGSVFYWLLRVFGNYDLWGLPFVAEMSPSFMIRFEGKFQVVPGVKYGSVVGSCTSDCFWALRLLDTMSGIDLLNGHGDGVIPQESQKFGDDLGTYNLDHVTEVGTDIKKRPEREKLMNRIWAYLHESK